MQNGHSRFRWSTIIAVATLFATPLLAAPVPLVNPGFEADFAADGTFPVGPVTGWATWDPFGLQGMGGNYTGVINPNGTAFFPAGAPEGNNAALLFLEGSIGFGSMGLSQFTGVNLEADTLYTVTVGVGNIASGTGLPPFDSFGFYNLDGFPGYSVQILANGVVLGEDYNTLSIPEGEFATSTVTAQVGPDDPILGFPIEIRLINLNLPDPNGDPGIEVDFDDVRFDATFVGLLGCNAADVAPPYDLLDLADVNAFVAAFTSMDGLADVDGSGVIDLADINLFIAGFLAGCP
jgi:hypothetical protein